MNTAGRSQARVDLNCRDDTPRRRVGFTLIELLVVIAIIGILASLLLPALVRAKSQALSAACLSNLKQLETCWHLYALDNSDYLPPNNFVYDIISDTPISSGDSWCTNLAPYDSDPVGIEHGLLFPYNTSDAIYRCPADKSTLETKAGVPLGQPRLRSYNMSQSINGIAAFNNQLFQDVPCFSKYTEINRPGPSACFAFIDVHENEILDTQFGIPTPPFFINDNVWWDVPANRHNQGCNFSFADGHCEHWRWVYPKVVTVPRGNVQPVNPAEMPDYQRMKAGFRQDFN